MKTICFHHNDADGRAAAAIVRRALGPEVKQYEINYGDPVPWNKVEKAQHIIMADFSLPWAEMLRLANGRQLTWIDHHKSAMDELESVAPAWAGLHEIGQAACVLTWRYFFPSLPVPRAVILIGDRDIWANLEPDSANFNEGLRQQETYPDNDKLWQPLLNDDPQAIQALVSQGAVLREARLREMRSFVNRFGYRVNFEGHDTLVVNRRGDGDLGQHIRDLGYAVAYCYLEGPQNERVNTFVTLFSEQVDVRLQRSSAAAGTAAAGFSSSAPPGLPAWRANLSDQRQT
jgi:hypothetical protein